MNPSIMGFVGRGFLNQISALASCFTQISDTSLPQPLSRTPRHSETQGLSYVQDSPPEFGAELGVMNSEERCSLAYFSCHIICPTPSSTF